MATDHRGRPTGTNHTSEPLADTMRRRALAEQMAKETGGKLVYGNPNDFTDSANRPIYSLPDNNPSTAGEVTTRLRRFAPTLHDPATGEYAMLRTPTITRAGANRKAARAAEHYAKEEYVK